MRDIDSVEEYLEAALFYLQNHMSYLPVDQRARCFPQGSYLNLPEIVAGADQCSCAAGADFCGFCTDYSIAFTTLVRAMGVHSSCIYSATTSDLTSKTKHAYNVVNYHSKYRIIEPQAREVTSEFFSSALLWENEEEYPFYMTGNIFNDKIGTFASDNVPLVKNRVLNYMGSDGLPNATKTCDSSSYTLYQSFRQELNNLGGWDPATLFDDVCP